ALHGLAAGTVRVVVASGEALLPRLSHPDRLRSTSLELKPGMDLGPIEFGDLLADAGFTREDPVDEHGEFCVRGGIVDWFPAGAANPIRVEFVGDTVESIRRYDPATQRSIGTLDQATVVPLRETFDDGATKVAPYESNVDSGRARLQSRNVLDIPCQPTVEFRGRIQEWIAEVRRMRERGDTVLFVAGTEGRAERTVELLAEYELRGVMLDRTDELLNVAISVTVGQLSKGFRLPTAQLQVIAEPDVFEEERAKIDRRGDRHRSIAKTFLSDLRDLKVGDFVVHVDHGIGEFVGLRQIGVGDNVQEFMELRYAGADKLFVPVERLDLVQKYSGTAKPPLDKLGGTSWERAKTRVR